MRYERNVAVVHLKTSELEQAILMQKRIDRALTRGRNVVLICDTPVVRRLERMVFACLTMRNLKGRFAIVAENADQFSETIPADLSKQLQVFESQDEAFDWVDPNPVDNDATMLELSVN